MASEGFVRGAFAAIRGYHCLWVGVSSLSWSPSPVHHLGNTNKPINPQVFRLGHSEEFPCLQLTWEMELLLFLSNTCPCTRRRAVSRNGIWACFERPEHLPPCARALPPALAEAGRSEVGHSVSTRLLSSRRSNQHQKITLAATLLALEEMTLMRQRKHGLQACY